MSQQQRQIVVGEVVWFWPVASQRGDKVQAWPAIVTHVFSESCVNLSVFADGSFASPEPTHTSVQVIALEWNTPTLLPQGACCAKILRACDSPGHPNTISVDFCVSKAHAGWLASGDRSYSPFNKPWDQLTVDERRQISRQAAQTLAIANENGAGILIIDEYVQPRAGAPDPASFVYDKFGAAPQQDTPAQ